MKVLFVGNSFSLPLLKIYEDKNCALGKNYECSFAYSGGGWEPNFQVINDRLIVGEAKNGFKPPTMFFPENLLEIPLQDYQAIVIGGLGYIASSSFSEASYITEYLIHEFEPKESIGIPTSKAMFIEIFNGVLMAQPGIKLLDYFHSFQGKVIIYSQPLYNELIIDFDNWILNKIYKRPVDAINFLQMHRRKFLEEKCIKSNYILIKEIFKSSLFTPSNFQIKNSSGDFLHGNDEYAKLLFEQIEISLLN
jgi:hypothetical protein